MSEIELLICAVIILGLLSVVILVLTLSFKVYFLKKTAQEIRSKKEKFQDYLSFIVINNDSGNYMHDLDEDDPVYLNKEDLQDEKYRKIFLDELISIHAVIDGDAKERLRNLYLGFGFASEIREKIFSKKWENRIDAINQVSAFHLSQFYPILVTCLHDKNRYVRKAAFLRYTALKTNPLDALRYVEGNINGWEKQVILENLKKRTDQLIPVFQNFKVKYPAHYKFLDELTAIYNQDSDSIRYLNNIQLTKA